MKKEKLIPTAHRAILEDLYIENKNAVERLKKEEKFERICVFAGAIGLAVTVLWILQPQQTTDAVGNLGLTFSFIAMIFGGWAYFAPPSKDKSRAENYIIERVKKDLEKYGYEPIIFDRNVQFKHDKNLYDIFADESYQEPASHPKPEQKSKLKKQDYQAPNLIFKTGVDAFKYLQQTQSFVEEFSLGQTYVGLVIITVPEKSTARIAAFVEENSEAVAEEVVATFDSNLTFEVKKHDLVLWECVLSEVGVPLGIIIAKATLEYDTQQSDFVWIS